MFERFDHLIPSVKPAVLRQVYKALTGSVYARFPLQHLTYNTCTGVCACMCVPTLLAKQHSIPP